MKPLFSALLETIVLVVSILLVMLCAKLLKFDSSFDNYSENTPTASSPWEMPWTISLRELIPLPRKPQCCWARNGSARTAARKSPYLSQRYSAFR